MSNDITYCTSTTCPLREICKRADIPKVPHRNLRQFRLLRWAGTMRIRFHSDLHHLSATQKPYA